MWIAGSRMEWGPPTRVQPATRAVQGDALGAALDTGHCTGHLCCTGYCIGHWALGTCVALGCSRIREPGVLVKTVRNWWKEIFLHHFFLSTLTESAKSVVEFREDKRMFKERCLWLVLRQPPLPNKTDQAVHSGDLLYYIYYILYTIYYIIIKLTRLSTPVTCGLRARWNEIIRRLIELILETERCFGNMWV